MPQQADPAVMNAYARQLIRQRSIRMEQPLGSQTIVPANTPQITYIPRNAGLIKGFWVSVLHNISNGSAVQINATDLCAANALSMVQFNDLQGNTRIQTPGWHLHFVNTMKARRPFGTALVRSTGIDTPILYGDVWAGKIAASATIAAAGTGTVRMWYWVPLAYSDDDLRGAVYANIVNATMQLILSMPGSNGVSVAVQNGTDSTLAMYVGNAAGAVTLVTITSTVIQVYQVYQDQIPTDGKGLPILPLMDLATIYELKQTSQSGITAAQDFGFQYPNFRDILSTMMIYVNTAATGARTGGTDMNYLALQSANFTNVWKDNPDLIALKTRNYLGTDTPPGCYYLGSREKPISSTQYGNMQLIINPITAGVGAYQLVGLEDFALVQSLSMAGSLNS